MDVQARPDGGGSFLPGRGSRWLLVGGCSVLGVLIALVTLGDALDQPDPPSDALMGLWLLGEVVAATVAVPLLVLVLRRQSLGASLALGLLAPLSAATPAAVVAVVLMVSTRSWRTGSLAVAFFVASSAAAVLALDSDEALGLLVALVVVTVLMVLVGTVLGSRRALAEQASRERGLLLEQARSQERARIASEMHDTLSHHLSLIALHAGALGRREDLPPESVRSSSRLVAELSRTAHTELREVLGVLHAGPQSTAPPPGATTLPQVVDQHRAAGAVIQAELDPAVVGKPADPRLSEATSRLLARVVRELLANAARHAPGVPVGLVVAADGECVVLRCRNGITASERPPAGSGLGLEGIAERVRLAGGRHHAGVVDGCFQVQVSVPW